MKNQGDRMGPRPKEFVFSTIVVIFSTVLAFGLGEAFLRLKNANMKNYDIEMWRYAKTLKRASANTILGHEHIPSRSAKLQSIDIRINRDGLRGAEIRPKGVQGKRVLFLGSSITLGWGVDEANSLTEILNTKFKGNGQSISVLNGGIGNYNTVRYVERFLTKLTHLNPDVIVVQYFVNDAEVLELGGGNWFLANSQLAVTLWIAFNRVFNKTGDASLIDHYKKVYDKTSSGYRAMRTSLEKLSQYAEKKNIPIILAMTPDIHMLEKYPFRFIHDDIKKVSDETGFVYVDLYPSFSKIKSQDLWAMPGDPHPNKLGHKLMANTLYPIIKKALSQNNRK